MRRTWSLPVLALLAIVACQNDRGAPGVDTTSNPLEVARGKPACTTDDITDLLDAGAFANDGLTNAIDVHCGQVEGASGEEQVEKAFETIDQILELAADGQVNPADGKSAEEVVEALLSAFLELAGIDTADRVVVAFIEPDDLLDGREDVVTPDGESALSLSLGDLIGPVVAAILPVESPPGGQCPFDFDPPQECYPQAWDWSFTPIENVVDDVDGWLCLDSTVLPQGVPENRIEIASEDAENPGTLRFWGNTPEASIPGDFTEFCPDEEPEIGFGVPRPDGMLGHAWDLASVFWVTPAYASPGKLGASIGAFSVFTPADPGPTTQTGTISGTVTTSSSECTQPIPGAAVSIPATNFATVTNSSGFYSLSVPFDTYTVEASASGFFSEEETGITVASETPDVTVDFCLQSQLVDF